MITWLPHINATLNGLALVLLWTGYWHIRRRREAAHQRCMLAAFVVSCLFLACYLVYHSLIYQDVGSHRRLPESIQGITRQAYYAMLISHIVLAALVPFLAVAAIYLGVTDRRVAHRRVAKLTFPIWVYVSVTGVLVYLVLYWLI